ncbi:MAG: SbcC/MukB-like Walker B domain-containing protein [Actinomycetota bacterium]
MRTAAERELAARHAEIQAKAEALGSAADSSLEELDAAVRAAQDAVLAADAADAALADAEAAAAEADRQRSLAVEAFGSVEQALAALAGRLGSERKVASDTQAAIVGLDSDRIRRVGATLDRIGDLVGRYQDAVAAVAKAEINRSAAVARLTEVLGASPFVDAEAARVELLDRSREEELATQVKTWRDGLTTSTAQLAELEGLGVPEVRPDAEALADRAQVAGGEAASIADRVSKVGVHLGNGRTALAEAEAEATGSADSRAEAETARLVHATCAGKGGRLKTPLDRWVLAGELELVADAANVHLSRLTAHRYQLRRDSEKELGLVIFDGHSGRERPTGSLSGGEKFQVSLALALGLADVVSRGGNASGRVYEALFVDEGFGSLDPAALDQAVGALSSLQAGGRMVGAITHVEAMKQQLHVGIEVRRRSEGSGSTLSVYP